MPSGTLPDSILPLAHAAPLAVGHLRQVFQHPRETDCVIKVMRADAVQSRWGAKARWYKRLPRARHYTGFVRELKEYIATQARFAGRNAPIARMVGVVETDLGLGLISEKVRDANGALAPTLAALYARENGFSALIETGLARFLEDLLACNVIVGDMHAWNIVYGSDSREGPRFVLIDGFGEKHFIPRSSMSRTLNAWNTRKLFRRMREQLVRLVPLERPREN
ncbi:MAG TPA: YrbL family protein [Dokdonella sp.]